MADYHESQKIQAEPCATNGRITHVGDIADITENHIHVVLKVRSACAHCSVRGGCGMADEKPRVVVVPRTQSQPDYQKGETVTVVMTQAHGTRAVLLGYVIPFVVLVAVLFGANAAGVSENVAAMAALVATVLYYLLLWLLRERIVQQFAFTIEQKR